MNHLADRFSKEYKQLYNETRRRYAKLPKFSSQEKWTTLDKKLLKLSKKISHLTPHDIKATASKKPKTTYEKVINAATRYSTVDSDYCDYETIRCLIQKIHKSCHRAIVSKDGTVPIINPNTSLTNNELCTLLGLFTDDTPEHSESVSKEELLKKLFRYIPKSAFAPATTKEKSGKCSSCSQVSKPELSACYWCSNWHCSACPLEDYQHSRISSPVQVKLCFQCIAAIEIKDADDWGSAAVKHLAKGKPKAIVASFGCAAIAMALGFNPQELLYRMAKALHNCEQYELAFNLLSPVLAKCEKENEKEKAKLHLLASSILYNLAQDSHKTLQEKHTFAVASQEVHSTIAKENTETSADKQHQIEGLLQQLNDQKAKQLEILWRQKDYWEILHYLKEDSSQASETRAVHESPSPTPFENFLTTKEKETSSMSPKQCHALQFLQCIFSLKKQDINLALQQLEKVAWNSLHSNISMESIIGAYLHVVEGHRSKVYSYAAMIRVLQMGSTALLFSPPSANEGKSSHLLFPSDSELTPPFEKNWPSFSREKNDHLEYETAVLKKYEERKWTEMDVAWAYLDQIPGCVRKAEKVVCYLHAAMWMAKQFNPKSEMKYSTLCSLRCIIMKILRSAISIAYKSLNSGMHLYTIRLALGIMRKIAQMPDSKTAFKDEDIAYVQLLLKKLLTSSQLFPFWNLPAVSVSEAVQLDKLTEKLHSSFIFGLQTLSPSHTPISSSDLKYQLFENDLLNFLPLKNASDVRARAMEDILSSQNRSWSDIMQALSSTLIRRDSKGWIIPSTNFKTAQPYSEITGFTIDTAGGCPSVQLKVLEADPKDSRRGMFSQDDINTMIQLDDLQIKLFFSLDPPDHDFDTKLHHPFQQWRYATEDIRDTEVLKSMFIADYLMKSFTVGSDVSAIPPFNQRPCKDGLTKHLPKKLREAIRSIGDRNGNPSKHPNYRFWIEAKEMKYSLQHTGSEIQCNFGEMEMTVKCHPMIRHEDGRLSDSDEDIDPNTREASFANDMTENYKELEHYFPVFARLRQLSKLQVFVNMIRPLLQGFNPFHSQKETQTNAKKMEWVPAAISNTPFYISYGGVSFNPTLTSLEYGESLPWSGKQATIVAVQRKPKVPFIQVRNLSYCAPKGKAEASSSSNEFSDGENSDGENSDGDDSDGDDGNDDNQDSSSGGSPGGSSRLLKAGMAALATGALSTGRKKKSDDKEEQEDKLYQTNKVASNIGAITGASLYTPPTVSGTTFREKNSRAINDKLDNLLHSVHNEVSTRPHTNTSAETRAPATSSQSQPTHTKDLATMSDPTSLRKKLQEQLPEIQPKVTASLQSAVQTSFPVSAKSATFTQTQANQATTETSTFTVGSTKGKNLPRTDVQSENKDNTAIQASTTPEHSGPTGKVSTGGNAPPPSGDDDPVDHEKPKRGYITACHGDESCRSPESIILEIVNNGFPFPGPGPDKQISGGDKINGLYVLINTKTGQIYVGRSCDVLRRISEHKNDIKNNRKTVGAHFESEDDMEFCVIPLPSDFLSLDMRFFEQLLMDKAAYHGYTLINIRRAMKLIQFLQETKIRGEKTYCEQ